MQHEHEYTHIHEYTHTYVWPSHINVYILFWGLTIVIPAAWGADTGIL